MKFLLLILIFICFVLIGILIKNYFLRCKIFYENLYMFCNVLNLEISFKNEKLNLIIKNNTNKFSDGFVEILKIFNDFLNNKLTKKNCEKQIVKKLNFLSNEEISLFLAFVFSLGEKSKEEELELILNFKKEIEERKQKSIFNNKRYSNLYFKLFLIVGLMIFIIFI